MQVPILETQHLINAQANGASSLLKEKTSAKLLEIVEESFLDPSFTHAEHWELKRENWRRVKQNSTQSHNL